jgi:hypothetical protein
VITNKSCTNVDGTASTILTPGIRSATGCGSTVDNARSRSKLSFQQTTSCMSDGDRPAPGCCRYSEQIVQSCLCR